MTLTAASTTATAITPKVGDKVVYCGPSKHPAWNARRTRAGVIVVAEAESPDYYTWVYDPTEWGIWQAKPGALRVVERATYEPVSQRCCIPCDSQGGIWVPCPPDDPDRHVPDCRRLARHDPAERCDAPGCRDAIKWRTCTHCQPSTPDTNVEETR